jgi:hypothetical protein
LQRLRAKQKLSHNQLADAVILPAAGSFLSKTLNYSTISAIAAVAEALE